jgi:hypothetical protein
VSSSGGHSKDPGCGGKCEGLSDREWLALKEHYYPPTNTTTTTTTAAAATTAAASAAAAGTHGLPEEQQVQVYTLRSRANTVLKKSEMISGACEQQNCACASMCAFFV